jgi:hypothetical protein
MKMYSAVITGTAEGTTSRGFVYFLEGWVNLYEGLIVQVMNSRVNRK